MARGFYSTLIIILSILCGLFLSKLNATKTQLREEKAKSGSQVCIDSCTGHCATMMLKWERDPAFCDLVIEKEEELLNDLYMAKLEAEAGDNLTKKLRADIIKIHRVLQATTTQFNKLKKQHEGSIVLINKYEENNQKCNDNYIDCTETIGLLKYSMSACEIQKTN